MYLIVSEGMIVELELTVNEFFGINYASSRTSRYNKLFLMTISLNLSKMFC